MSFPLQIPMTTVEAAALCLSLGKRIRKVSSSLTDTIPPFEDMLDYVEGRLRPGSEGYARFIQWVVLDDFGFDAVSALRRSLKEHSTDKILFLLKKGKDDLRQLLSASALALYSNPRFNTLKH
jgi:hypothetical protein